MIDHSFFTGFVLWYIHLCLLNLHRAQQSQVGRTSRPRSSDCPQEHEEETRFLVSWEVYAKQSETFLPLKLRQKLGEGETTPKAGGVNARLDALPSRT